MKKVVLQKEIFMEYKTIKIAIIFLLFCCFSNNSFCQLAISTAMTPAQLVQNVLIGGGITISNITYTGGANSKAFFTNGATTNLGINSGIILSTGVVTQIANPASYFMSTNLGLAGDANLNAIANGGTSYDASVLQFDFVPLSDTVRFRYVFGSEEYPAYVCSQYFDVFGFFLSGQNPAGGNYTNYNIARIPGTALQVGINSVNNGTPGGSYSGSNCVSLAYSNYYVDNAALNGTTICFGGFTTPLTAWCHVVPCQTYHVKLAVGDVYNGLFDSGVFLEANSFSSNSVNLSTSYSNSTFGNNAIEGCSNGAFSFVSTSLVTSATTINYTISGTATNGVDYPVVPGSITIPAGQDSVAVVISPIMDGIPEGTETVILTYVNNCSTQSDTIFIEDNSALSITAIDTVNICPGNSTTLTFTPGGGMLPYTYAWSNGAGNVIIAVVSPAATTTYTVTVNDNCGQSTTHNFVVTVGAVGSSVTSTNENCGRANGTATALPTGVCTQGWTYIWNSTPVQTSQTAINLPAGTYTVTVSCGGCTSTSSAVITNIPGPSVAIIDSTNTTCGNANGGAIASANGTNPPFNYVWPNGQNTSSLTNVVSGTYIVTITDAVGCTATNSITLTDTPGPVATMVGTVNADCGLSDGSATMNVSGGSPPYSYNWNSTPVQSTLNLSNVPAGNYSFTVTDSIGCTSAVTITVAQNPGPSASVTTQEETCNHSNGSATVTASGGIGTYSYLWSNGQTSTTITGLTYGFYTVTVSESSCSTIVTANLMQSPGPEGAFSEHPRVITTMDGPVQFFNNSSTGVVNWQWDFGDGTIGSGANVEHTYSAVGTYMVTLIVTDNNGCSDTVTDSVKVKDIFTLYVPSAFTPDADGKNDLFYATGITVDPNNFSMMIFDRWGNLVFKTTKWDQDRSEGWNGTINNKGTIKDAVIEVYVYVIVANEIDGPEHDYMGRVTLVR